MSKHIFWISSYPKSGNTLVRAIISALFFSRDGKFQLEQLKHTSQFERRDRVNLIKKINEEEFLNLDQLKILSKYWLTLQNKENIRKIQERKCRKPYTNRGKNRPARKIPDETRTETSHLNLA